MTTVVMLRDARGEDGKTWRYGETKACSEKFALSLIGRGDAYDEGGGFADVILGAAAAGGQIPSNRFAQLDTPPLGFNAYQLIYDVLQGNPQYNSDCLDYVVECGCKIVRVMWPGFNSSDYTTYVFASGPTTTVTDAALRTSFIAACDSVFDAAAARGLKLWVSMFWTQSALPVVFGESMPTAYSSASSQTMQCMQSFLSWFLTRYARHPAMGVYSWGNEWRFDETGSTLPTSAQLGARFGELAAAVRAADPGKLVTANLEGPVVQTDQARTTPNVWAQRYKTVFRSLDAWTLHFYDTTTNYIGRQVLDNAAFQALDANSSGYEGADTILSAMRAAAAGDGKLFIVGEFGVSIDVEVSSKLVKKRRFLRAITRNSDLALIWNVQALNTAPANQLNIYIQRGTARGNVWKGLVADYSGVRFPRFDSAGGIASLTESKRPSVCWTPTRSAANGWVNVTAGTQLASAAPRAVMFWARSNVTSLASFEPIADCRNGTDAYGFSIVGDSTAGTGLYCDFRGSTGGAGNTAAVVPALVQSEWHHYAFVWGLINGTPGIEIFVDGIYWKAVLGSASIVPAAIPATTVLKLGGQSVGGPLSLQDFAVLPSATLADITAHMRGEVSPTALMHIRALANGTVVDFSRGAAVASLGAGCAVEIA